MEKLFQRRHKNRHKKNEPAKLEWMDFDEEEYDDDEEYYEDDEAEDEEEYYEDDEAEDEDEYYEDDEVEDDEYYEDDEAEDEDEYYEDDEAEDDEEYDEDEYYEDEEEERIPTGFKGVLYRLTHLPPVDYIVALTGGLVLALVIFTGSMYLGAKDNEKQVAAFSEVGTDLEGVSVIGEQGLLAIADAQAAKLMTAQIVEEETWEQQGQDQKEEQGGTEVGMNLTSIQKDLKIKFVNKKTDRLVANLAFEVEIKKPSGETYTKKDDDKDGIIYQTDMEPGKYKVKIIAPQSDDAYQITTEEMTITVRDKIEYKKVDVADEVKTEAQVNVAVEDTKVNETVVESTNTDTVEWVESTKTLIEGTEKNEDSYEEVDKSKIADPGQKSAIGFRLLTATEPQEEESTPVPTEEPAPAPTEEPTAAPTEEPTAVPAPVLEHLSA